MKIRPVGDDVFRADRQTDMTKLIVAFSTFANAPKNVTKQQNYPPLLPKVRFETFPSKMIINTVKLNILTA
jgi:hypothetical protein